MRVFLLLIAIVGLTSLPAATAGANTMPPTTIVALQTREGDLYLSWTPVVGATSYIVLAGDTETTMVAIAETTATMYHMVEADVAPYIGVATRSGVGDSEPHSMPTDTRGDCISTTSKTEIGVSLKNCLGTP